MSLTKDVEILRRIPLFAKLEPAKLKLLAFTSERLTFRAGQELFHQGDVGDAAFVLLNGTVEVLVDSPTGLVNVATVEGNEIVGEIAILCDVPRTATVAAKTEVETLRVSKDSFFHLVHQFPQIGVEVMNELASRLHQTTQQLGTLSSRLRDCETRLGQTSA
ncbi:cyclic nucleotide-binding domain-containing protein [Marinivivus vitaminiproducens]|uniref:cyclic nucleotide-binding domain-containing protein n=1 Tax=Marinivivus vitaminiproducens TaxID=3035935 RepID=UPI0027A311E4|nr:cyclic nucleotide-binding domain-containing protein [Geminicoccaceae bacterium SCSIO 64248]